MTKLPTLKDIDWLIPMTSFNETDRKDFKYMGFEILRDERREIIPENQKAVTIEDLKQMLETRLKFFQGKLVELRESKGFYNSDGIWETQGRILELKALLEDFK